MSVYLYIFNKYGLSVASRINIQVDTATLSSFFYELHGITNQVIIYRVLRYMNRLYVIHRILYRALNENIF